MIKTLIFDNNGVLTTSDSERGLKRISDFLELEESEFKHVWEEKAGPLDDGRITTREFHESILDHFELERDYDEFKEIHLGNYIDKPEVKDFVRDLKDSYELALLTNFGDGFDECNEVWRMEEIFGDKMYVSCKVKMRKPNEDIYLHVLDELRREPEETIFIDDNRDNIEAAARLGINAILFTDLQSLKKDLAIFVNL